MGNSNSLHHQAISPQWVQSYPRPRHVPPQVKVLPERLPPLRLRTTDNGAILHNGGTISGRKQSVAGDERVYRPRSSSAHRPPKPEDVALDKTRYGSEPDLRFPKESKEQLCENAVRQRISRSRKKYKAPPAPPNGSGLDSSSPDLNAWDSRVGDCAGTSARKVRLFKTRAESNKKNLSGRKEQERAADAEEPRCGDEGDAPKKAKSKATANDCGGSDARERAESKAAPARSSSRQVTAVKRNLATPEFQAELREAARRLRPNSGRHFRVGDAADGAGAGSARYHRRGGREEDDDRRSTRAKASHGEGCKDNKLRRGHESESKKAEKTERDVPSKKFYFGMEENNNDVKIVNSRGNANANNVDKTNAEHRMTAVEKSKNLVNAFRSAGDGRQDWEDSLEKFAATFHKAPVTSVTNGNTTSCSSSFVSDPDEDVDGGIALQLRPTLPKKQLEIPRFSPTAAWRLLSSIETHHHPTSSSPACSDEGPVLLEERIGAPLSQQALRNGHDKSGDSGISGDASPGGCHESLSEVPPKAPSQSPKNLLMAWTPQQDLEEESSSDDLESPPSSPENVASNVPGAKFSPRGQLFASRGEQAFSLSLPRDESLGHYLDSDDFKGRSIGSSDHLSRFNSLKKLKAALATSKRSGAFDEANLNQDGNWVLSRSVPGSLNNSGRAAAIGSASNPSSPDQDEDLTQPGLSLKYPSYSYLASGGRMMYLPEYHSRLSPDAGKAQNGMRNSTCLSKSCENISSTEIRRQIRRTPSPVVAVQNAEERCNADGNSHKKKKFAFQSTIRLIENKKLAERLSREAEMKENQRLTELEAMKKVEEEFQKKRAREKANIRQQLRLFTMEEKNCCSLPPMDWSSSSCRIEPDGAPSSLPAVASSSSASSSAAHGPRNNATAAPSRKSSALGDGLPKYAPVTQVLSEYREPMRDYRDYRISRYHDAHDQGSDSNKRSVVEHPRVVYDMPKNTPVYVSAHAAQNQSLEGEARATTATPRSSSSDNYRKDFAHGALAAGGRSLAGSDSELSQSHHVATGSRQGVTSQNLSASGQRSRSASPESCRSLSPDPNRFPGSSSSSALRSASASPSKIASEERSRSRTPERVFPRDNAEEKERSRLRQRVGDSATRSPDDSNSSADACYAVGAGARSGTNRSNKESQPIGINELPRIGLSSLQPFKKTEKSFRPISFNPMNNKLAQPVS